MPWAIPTNVYINFVVRPELHFLLVSCVGCPAFITPGLVPVAQCETWGISCRP